MTDQPCAYIPQGGTIARNALAALVARFDDKLTTPELVEAIGQIPGYPGLPGNMESCVLHGLVQKEPTEDGRYVRWWATELGRSVVHWLYGNAQQLSQAPTFAEVGDEIEPPAEEEADAPPPDCEFALTSTGRLLIEFKGQKFALDKPYADALFAHTDYARGVGPIGGEA